MARWLLTHQSSNCIFEVQSFRAFQQCVEQGCEDVTGLPKYESQYNPKKGPTKMKSTRVAVTEGASRAGSKKPTDTSKPAPPPPVRRGVSSGKVSPPDIGMDWPEPPEQPFHVKHRPKTLAEVVGQDATVKSLKAQLKAKQRPHSFLFTGPSGCGKTTLARILAAEFNCSPANILETDAATNTGIDAMREITSTLRYQGFGDQPNKMIILDEAHALTKQAWQSLLKAVEEPPEHVYFAFCTTDAGKVPDTIRTRCSSYDLKPVRFDDLMDLLEDVADLEKLDISDAYLEQVARACGGSPRQALVMLSMVLGCEDEDEVARILETPLENKEVIDLCRLLVAGKLDWVKAVSLLKAMPETAPESIRIVVVNYLNACLMGAKSERDVPRLLDLLADFSKPCNPTDKLAPILLAIGNNIFPA